MLAKGAPESFFSRREINVYKKLGKDKQNKAQLDQGSNMRNRSEKQRWPKAHPQQMLCML